jgi:excisionase family DNA binding protein
MSEDQFSPDRSDKPKRDPMKSLRGLMTPKDASADMGVSTSLVYELVEKRLIGHHRIGGKGKRGRILISIADLEAYLEKTRVEPETGEPQAKPAPAPVPTLKHLELS